MANTTSLLPKEHGAYAELAFPLITGLALAAPNLSAWALALAAVCLFLANEPLAIRLGIRGRRLKNQVGGRASTRAAFLLGGATGLGLLGTWVGTPHIWPEILFPALSGALLLPLVLVGRQKTLWGEFVVLTAFATMVLPLASASGAHPLRAAMATGVWWISFALGTLEVHAIKARIKEKARNRWTRWGSPLAAGLVVVGAGWLALGQAGPLLREGGPGASEAARLLPPAGAALLVPALAIFLLSLLRVHPRHLKRVGWTLVGANGVALVLLLQG